MWFLLFRADWLIRPYEFQYLLILYSAISLIACVLLSFLFLVQVGRIWNQKKELDHHHCSPDCSHTDPYRWSAKGGLAYVILLTPVLAGFLLPPKTLDASMAEKKGVLMQSAISSPSAPAMDGASQETDHTPPMESIDPVYLEDLYEESLNRLVHKPTIVFNDFDFVEYADTISFYPQEFVGKNIELTGFVYKEEGMTSSQLVVARFIITHCLADAGVIGFLAEWDEAEKLKEDTWINVKGTLEVSSYGDYELPLLKVTEWEEVEMPADPYVYPKLN